MRGVACVKVYMCQRRVGCHVGLAGSRAGPGTLELAWEGWCSVLQAKCETLHPHRKPTHRRIKPEEAEKKKVSFDFCEALDDLNCKTHTHAHNSEKFNNVIYSAVFAARR